LVLQLLPVGGAIMADRYSYIPSIGLFYMAGEFFYMIWNKNLKFIAISLLSLSVIFYSINTFSRTKVWQNDLTLWNDVLKKDSTISIAYSNRGNYLLSQKQYDSAINDFNKSIYLKEDNYRAYSNRGIAYMTLKKNDAAKQDFIKTIQLRPDHFLSFSNLGLILMKEKKYDSAIYNFNKAIEINPDFSEFYYNRGNAFYNQAKYEDAIQDYSKAIELNKDYAKAYFNRGMSSFNAGKKDNACSDLKKAATLGIQPSSDILQQACK
jgi:tetratricopeptide (TPR) repeat protein